MALTFDEIDQRRAAAGIAPYALCRKAQVQPGTYYRLKTGKHAAKRRTLQRLAAALEAGPAPDRKAPAPEVLRQHFNLMLNTCAQAAGIPVPDALNVNPHANRPRDLNWIAAMRVRQLAVYLVITEGNVRGAELARAIGTTKQAVSKALRAVEDRRDDPALDRLLEIVAELLRGNPA
jgi:transcriptional regulator with XRE-family HTH domain